MYAPYTVFDYIGGEEPEAPDFYTKWNPILANVVNWTKIICYGILFIVSSVASIYAFKYGLAKFIKKLQILMTIESSLKVADGILLLFIDSVVGKSLKVTLPYLTAKSLMYSLTQWITWIVCYHFFQSAYRL